MSKITIQANSGAFDFECDEAERILYAGLMQGLNLPYECATGTCGTCRGRVQSGSALVEWNEAPGYARLKRDKGDILMCQARPTGDCVIRVPANLTTTPDSALIPRHRTGHLRNLRRLTHDVIDFDLVLSQPVTFDAGQFVVLELPGLTGGRAYSMVNYRRETDTLKLVVKQKPNGGFSTRLFEHNLDGHQVKVFGSLGRATFRPHENRNVLCIAGGSGIAGMLAILEHARTVNYFAERTGRVYFGVRTLADGFYLQEFSDYVAAAGGKLQVTLALSEQAVDAPTHPQFPNIRLASGLVVDVMAREMAGQYDQTVSFLAGPTPMVDEALRILIRVERQPPAFVRYDKYT